MKRFFGLLLILFILLNSLGISVVEHYCSESDSAHFHLSKSDDCHDEEPCCTIIDKKTSESEENSIESNCCNEEQINLQILQSNVKKEVNAQEFISAFESTIENTNLKEYPTVKSINVSRKECNSSKVPIYLEFQNIRL